MKNTKILPKDLILCKELRQDSRTSLKKISKKTRIPITTLHDRLKQQQGNLITKHTSLLNFELLGINARIQMMIKADIGQRDMVEKYLRVHERINNIWKISGEYDYLVEGCFENINNAEKFIEEIETKFNVKQDSHYIVKDIRREGFLSS